jgi:chitinase
MYGIDGGIYYQGTADFIVAMTEAVITGFNTSGGLFAGLPQEKIAIGLPACNSAGGGFIDSANVKQAINYLLGNGPAPGTYTLQNTNAYPNIRGMMTWSINWDAVNTCETSYNYASNFEQIFMVPTSTKIDNLNANTFHIFPNPSNGKITIVAPQELSDIIVTDVIGTTLYHFKNTNSTINLELEKNGIYFITSKSNTKVYIKKVVINK